MIAYRKKHRVISRRLPDAVCGRPHCETHSWNGDDTFIPEDARVIAVLFSGYDQEKGTDDIVYMAVNTHWEDAKITLPRLRYGAKWYLSANTYGDAEGRYFYPEGQEIWISGDFVMRPRSVAVFTVKLH